jgi:potassium inwardly-rectifying channel subfamily J
MDTIANRPLIGNANDSDEDDEFPSAEACSSMRFTVQQTVDDLNATDRHFQSGPRSSITGVDGGGCSSRNGGGDDDTGTTDDLSTTTRRSPAAAADVDEPRAASSCPRRSDDGNDAEDERRALLSTAFTLTRANEDNRASNPSTADAAHRQRDDDDDELFQLEKIDQQSSSDLLLDSADQHLLQQQTRSTTYDPETTLRDPNVVRPLADRGRKYAARQTRRLVYKDGSCKISSRNVTERKRKYLVDIFTTLVDMRWRYNVLLFTATFVISWLTFSVVWFLIALVHSDFEHRNDEDWQPCISNVYDFPTALLFSIETQTTIGYGYRVVQPDCPISFVVLIVQSCFGVFIQSLMTGLVFSKLARPKQRAHTIMFSRVAVVSKRDYEYCLLFRVGDMRKSHIIGTSIRALMVKDRLTKEGEVIPLCQCPLDLETETCNSDSFVFLVWPVTVVHKINSSSPLWDVSAEQMLTERFEIIVILEGIVESTGMTTQLRTSYLPSEILWGHRLSPLLTYQKENGQYKIDYAQFHAVEPIQMPDCSAKSFADTLPVGSDAADCRQFLPVYYFSGSTKSGGGGSRGSVIGRVRGSLSLRRRRRSRRESVRSGDGGGRHVTGDVIAEPRVPPVDSGKNETKNIEMSVSNNNKVNNILLNSVGMSQRLH